MASVKIGQYIPTSASNYYTTYGDYSLVNSQVQTGLYNNRYYMYDCLYQLNKQEDETVYLKKKKSYRLDFPTSLYNEDTKLNYANNTTRKDGEFLAYIGTYSTLNKKLLNDGQKISDDFLSIYDQHTQQDKTQSIVVTPQVNSDYLLLQYCHPIEDFLSANIETAQKLQCRASETIEAKQLQNLMTTEMGLSSSAVINKIAIQADPGLVFYLNEQRFVMGKSGIFEFENKNITFSSFYIASDSNTDIIVDYQYIEEE